MQLRTTSFWKRYEGPSGVPTTSKQRPAIHLIPTFSVRLSLLFVLFLFPLWHHNDSISLKAANVGRLRPTLLSRESNCTEQGDFELRSLLCLNFRFVSGLGLLVVRCKVLRGAFRWCSFFWGGEAFFAQPFRDIFTFSIGYLCYLPLV